MTAPMSKQQRAALVRATEPQSGGAITGHSRTVAALVQRGLAEAVHGWYEKSVARRVGRLYAKSSTWGVVGYRITAAGRAAVALPSCTCTDGRVRQVTARGHVISLPCPTCTRTGGERP